MPQFDDNLLFNLRASLTRLSRSQWIKVEKTFRYVQKYEGELFNSEPDFLINALNKKEKKSLATKTGSKLSEEQIAYVRTTLKALIISRENLRQDKKEV